MLKQSAPEPVEERTTILLSSNGTKLERTTTVAATICARDRKGFGNQAMNAVVETGGGGGGGGQLRNNGREIGGVPKRSAPGHKPHD